MRLLAVLVHDRTPPSAADSSECDFGEIRTPRGSGACDLRGACGVGRSFRGARKACFGDFGGVQAIHSDLKSRRTPNHCMLATNVATMKAPSTALLRAFSPLCQSSSMPWASQGCIARQQTHAFSSTPQRHARNRGGPKTDPRIGMAYSIAARWHRVADETSVNIRYHLNHPITPRPLRFSRFVYHTTSSLTISNSLTAPALSVTGRSTAPGSFTKISSALIANSSSANSTNRCTTPVKHFA